jgi:hypothetical protein
MSDRVGVWCNQHGDTIHYVLRVGLSRTPQLVCCGQPTRELVGGYVTRRPVRKLQFACEKCDHLFRSAPRLSDGYRELYDEFGSCYK